MVYDLTCRDSERISEKNQKDSTAVERHLADRMPVGAINLTHLKCSSPSFRPTDPIPFSSFSRGICICTIILPARFAYHGHPSSFNSIAHLALKLILPNVRRQRSTRNPISEIHTSTSHAHPGFDLEARRLSTLSDGPTNKKTEAMFFQMQMWFPSRRHQITTPIKSPYSLFVLNPIQPECQRCHVPYTRSSPCQWRSALLDSFRDGKDR